MTLLSVCRGIRTPHRTRCVQYARKEWGGLVRSYYRARYALILDMADASLASNTTWSQPAYDQKVLSTVCACTAAPHTMLLLVG